MTAARTWRTNLRDPMIDRVLGPGKAWELEEVESGGERHQLFKGEPRNLAGLYARAMAHADREMIVAGDTRFYELTGQLFPGRDMRGKFEGDPALSAELVRRNTTLQGAYMILAARALGLDCGPMSGFNAETLNAEFFPDGRWKADFLFNLGYGSDENLFPRNPRLAFEQACLDL